MEVLLDPDIVNSVGLLLDIGGVVMLFFFGLPSKVEHPDSGIVVEWGVPPAETERRRRQWHRHQFMARLGLAMLILGFVLQIVSNHIGSLLADHPSADLTPAGSLTAPADTAHRHRPAAGAVPEPQAGDVHPSRMENSLGSDPARQV